MPRDPQTPEQLLGDFPGLVNNIDGRDLPPGAGQIQVNLQSRIRGQLTSRRGLQTLSFETTTTVGLAPSS